MRLLTPILLILMILLQVDLWFTDSGFIKVHELQQAIELQQAENVRLDERNRALEAEVVDLKEGYAAIEERARSELGMVGEGETFFQVVE